MYEQQEIFNADECGFKYCMEPDATVSHQPLPGVRNQMREFLFFFVSSGRIGEVLHVHWPRRQTTSM